MAKKTKERPEYFVGWVHKGRKHFEVVPRSQFDSLIDKLLDKGVHPGAIFFSQMFVVHWLYDEYHKGCRSVSVYKFWDEINGIDDPDCYYKPPKLEHQYPKEDISPNYGYVKPNGIFFKCPYQGHSSLAKELVGEVVDTDPQKYLFSQGWLCIYHDPFNKGTYAVQMAYNKKMTDAQFKTLERLGIPTNADGFQDCLLGRGIE